VSAPELASNRSDAEFGARVCVRIDRTMQMLDIGKTKLYELIAAGELETVHIGRRTLVLQTSIDDLITRLRHEQLDGRRA
jgi:hypothetical protein